MADLEETLPNIQTHLDYVMAELVWLNDMCKITVEFGDYEGKNRTLLKYHHHTDFNDNVSAKLSKKNHIVKIEDNKAIIKK